MAKSDRWSIRKSPEREALVEQFGGITAVVDAVPALVEVGRASRALIGKLSPWCASGDWSMPAALAFGREVEALQDAIEAANELAGGDE